MISQKNFNALLEEKLPKIDELARNVDRISLDVDSWNKCKDAFISKYFPPTKIISLRNDIMNFKQLDHEHVAQAWERMKLMIRNCPTHGLNLWIIIQFFYAGLNFAFRNLLDSAAGGTFMEITLG